MSVRVGNDIIAGSTSDQLISTAIETHNRDVNAHADIRAGISAATPVVDLGEISEASFEVNKNYAASVSGPAAFTLPTPTDTTIVNKITVNLTVLVASTIDWGANANVALTQFGLGKYQIRFLWNNNSSAWTAEVLKENEVSSQVKLLVRFNGDMVDESASPITLTPSLQNENFPVYTEGQYGQKKLVCNQDFVAGIHLIASGDNLSKLNLGTGDFTIKYWYTFGDYGRYIFKKDDSNYISIRYTGIEIKLNGTTIVNKSGTFATYNSTGYVAITRNNGVLYIFINGTLVHSQASTEEWDLSGFTRIFDEVKSGNSIQELIIKSTCDYVANFTVPSAPFVLSDSGLSDLHDDTKENISNKTADYTASDENTYPSSKALKDAVSYLENNLSTHNTDTNAHPDIRQFLETLQLVQWVDTLPETGESKYIYAVPREETDTDGKPIAALYLWDGTRWNGAGAFSLNIDPDTIAKKTDLTNYLPLTGGTLSGALQIVGPKSVIQTYSGTETNGNTKLIINAKDGNWAEINLSNTAGTTRIAQYDTGTSSIRNNKYGSAISISKVLSFNGNKVLDTSDKSVANGVASLDANAKVPSEQIPVATASALGGIKVEFDETTGTLNIKTE